MKTGAFLFVMMSVVPFSVSADESVESDGDQLLLTSCQALSATLRQEEAIPCLSFIRGIVAAGQVIDPPVVDQQTGKNRNSYGFMSRGYIKSKKTLPARFFPFCVFGEDLEVRAIQNVSSQLSLHQIDTVNKLGKMIVKILEAEYPCRKTDPN